LKRIEEFTSLELLSELKKRCSPFVFIGHKIEEGGQYSHWIDWGGSEAICFGLCHTLAFYVQQRMINDEVNHIERDD
jgi:hypothetical protein